MTEQVSKQTVKNVIHGTVIEMQMRIMCRLSCGRKTNTLMPKLVCVYEDIIEESGEASKIKRYKPTGKHYFCEIYKGKENKRLWE